MVITKQNKGLDDNFEWIFKPDPLKYYDTGYDDVIHKLKAYDREDFKTYYTKEQKDVIVEELFQIYRGRNIFPINYYSDYGIEEELLKTMKRAYRLEKDGRLLKNKANEGLSLCKYLFPALHMVERVDDISNLDKFYDDKKLRTAILLSLEINFTGSPRGVMNGITLVGSSATNFKPISAKALYEWFTPKGGIIYDSSCGFGGRLFGALSSYNDYTYIGTDPNKAITKPLNRLGKLLESMQGRNNAFKIFCMGSENFKPNMKGVADFSFTSPPYFNCEVYSKDKTQCYNKYSNGVVQWLEGFMRPTIQNTRDILKDGAHYALNIADFNDGNKRVAYVDHSIRIAEQEGFKYLYKIKMDVTDRMGSGHEGPSKDKEDSKSEGVYIFKKI